MCLIVKDIPENLKPLTAEKDIHVFKVLKHRNNKSLNLNIDRIFSPYMMTPITFNFWGKCIMEANMDGKYRDQSPNFTCNFIEHDIIWENGEIACIKKVPTLFDKGACLSVYAGIHAYITREDAPYHSYFGPVFGPTDVQEKIHKAVIPKGAHYFIGEGNEIVADKMIIYRKTVKRKK